MAEMERKGGKVGGKRCLETMTPDARSEAVAHAARARLVRGADTTHHKPDRSVSTMAAS